MSTKELQAAAEDYPATIWQSVRKDAILWAVVLPLLVVAVEGIGGFLYFENRAKDQARMRALANQYANIVQEYQDLQVRSDRVLERAKELNVTPEAVVDRVNHLSVEYDVALESVTDKLSSGNVVFSHPMKPTSSGISLRVVGTPEHLHQFFGSLEAEFPTIVVMSTTMETEKQLLRVTTDYLIPLYDLARK